jgi:hypothetical protein
MLIPTKVSYNTITKKMTVIEEQEISPDAIAQFFIKRSDELRKIISQNAN